MHEDDMRFYEGMEERRIEDQQIEDRIAAYQRAEGIEPDSWGLEGWLFS